MGFTTIIELNHDFTSEIEDNHELFINQILNQLRSAAYEGKRIQGGQVICSFHRSENFQDTEWQKFKNKLRIEREKYERITRELD
jgi:hypothetical protein